MECALVVQAVAVAEFGPFAPVRMETCPDARLTMVAGMKNGEMRPGPFSSSVLCSRSMTSNPPMPLPMYTPTRSAFCGVHFEAGACKGEIRRRDGELDESPHLLDFFFLDVMERDRNP